MDYRVELEDLVAVLVKEGGSDLHIGEGRQPVIRAAGFLIPLIKKEVTTRQEAQSYLDMMLTPENKKLFIIN